MSRCLVTWGRFFKKDENGNIKKVTIPAPNTDPGKPYLWNYLCQTMPDLAKNFDELQFPGASKCWGGNGDGCDGYGVFDLRDIGRKKQQGGVPTRYGYKKDFLAAIAVAHTNGLKVLLDIVLHQLMGENGGPGVFKYLGASGKEQNGRGQTNPGWFRGNTGNQDPVPPFCLQDDVPNKFYDFSMAKKDFYSEYFEGNPATLDWWAKSWPMQGRSGVADFTNHWAIKNACDGGTARPLVAGGYNMWDASLSSVFVDNPDTDTSDGQQVVNNKGIAYAYALTVPCRRVLIYGKDYFPGSVWPGSYGLKPLIDNLCYINAKFAYGKFSRQYLSEDGKAVVFQRDGQGGSTGNSAGLITAINFDEFNNKTVTHPVCFWPGTELHDFRGQHSNIHVSSQQTVTYTIPKNAFKKADNTICFSWVGGDGGAIQLRSRYTTQEIEGHEHIDEEPASPEGTVVGTFICKKGSNFTISMLEGHGISFVVMDSKNEILLERGKWKATIKTEGEHTIRAYADKKTAFKANFTYKAPFRWRN
jgi:alpha-amylase